MSRYSARRIMLIMTFLLIGASAVLQPISAYLNRERYPHETAPAAVSGVTEAPTGTFQELAYFSSNLPLVVLELDRDPGKAAVWNIRKRYAVPTLTDPLAEGTLYIYQSESGINRLTDNPELKTRIKTRYRGLTSINFPKKQYFIKFYTEDGQENRQDVLGMGKGWEWILNIAHIDKSLLRNYLCLNIAHRASGFASQTRFCEAFRKRGDQYEYLGVYLLMEPVGWDRGGVNLTKYNPRHAPGAYLLRRDRFQGNAVLLDTFATINKLSQGFLEVKYPGKRKITDKTVTYIEKNVSAIEKMLYAETREEFLTYRESVDMLAAADYFIINEFFGNYDSQMNSYYMHRDLLHKLKLGPVWDFDQAIGNNAPLVFSPQSIAMQEGVWFRQLLRDNMFANLVVSRYKQLRRGVLSEENLFRFIDETIAYIGDARLRDWNRWRYDNIRSLKYAEGDVIHPALLNSRTYEEEIERIKKLLHEHGTYMDENLETILEGYVEFFQ